MEAIRDIRFANACERAAQAPYTFHIPRRIETSALRPGDLVKLCFEWDAPFEKFAAERMWVIIKSVGPDVIAGELRNEPIEKGKMKSGESVFFHRHNILAIRWASPAPDLDVPKRRQYWERCIVDDCVANGSARIEYLYREEPQSLESERYFDSGWRIHGYRGGATGAREMQCTSVGAVLNKDDSWLHLIDAPIGSAFIRNFYTGAYEPAMLMPP